MERKSILMSLVTTAFCVALCMADRQLDRSEVLQLFKQLTSTPRVAWIHAGTIQGLHEQYRAAKVTDANQIREKVLENVAKYQTSVDKPEQTESLQKLRLDAIPFNTMYELSNEYTISSVESVKYDGQRFNWEINIQSRTDSVKPGKDLEGNFMTDQFNMELNARKVFAWDGEHYTIYSPLAQHAYVDSREEMPHQVNGPLTAGLIPWGYGYYSYDNLSTLESEATESTLDGKTQINVMLNNNDGSQTSLVLDPTLQYAVTSCSIIGQGNATISKYYSDYENVSGRWIPMSILLEKYEADSQKLLARDVWTITAVDANVPSEDSFQVEYDEDTLIEYASPITTQPLIYRYSSAADTDALLGEKLVFDTKNGTEPQNCATASMKYALGRLGVDVSDSQLAELVNEPDNSTSLYDMKQFIQNLGLNCRAVQTDLKTLTGLGNCQIILYLPQKQHFVVVDSIDGGYVRIVDLASRKFYYRTDISFFDMDWTTGMALVISKSAIQGDLQDIGDSQLNDIVGAAGYSCTKVLQNEKTILCQQVDYECLGYYTYYYRRLGCEAAESGSCSTTWFVRLTESPCIENIYNPGTCTVTGDWTDYWMRACE
jgi:hypothetical protein